MNRLRASHVVLAGALAIGTVPPLLAQGQAPAAPRTPVSPVPPQRAPVVVYQNPDEIPNFRNVQEQLRRILEAYPPSVREVLRIDPSLSQRDDYIAAYPA